MKHLYIKRYRYKGYTINVYTPTTAVVVCKELKRYYIPFYSKKGCERGIDVITEIKSESCFAIWSYKDLVKHIKGRREYE